MTQEFKLPALQGLENGQLEIIAGQGNGWVVKKPIGLTQVWEHEASGSELAIICARLEPGEKVLLIVSTAADDITAVTEFLHVDPDGDDGDAEMDEYLTATVKRGLATLQANFV